MTLATMPFSYGPERRPNCYSHKFKRSDVCYNIAIGIKSGDICWICGPISLGFEMMRISFTNPSGLGWSPLHVLRPMMVTSVKHLQKLSVHSVSLALKKGRWRRLTKGWSTEACWCRFTDITLWIIVMSLLPFFFVTQLAISNGEPLFPVEYND